MNHFILIQSKNSTIETVRKSDIDVWYVFSPNTEPKSIQDQNDFQYSSEDILIGHESKYSLSSLDDDMIKTLIIGDPYKLYPDSSTSIMEYIKADAGDQVHHSIGGAFAWIEIFSKDKQIKIHTDMFGQLPLFYYHDEDTFAVATSIDLLLQSLPSIPRNVNLERIIEFIVTGDVADEYPSFFKYIHRLKGNQTLTYDYIQNTITINQYVPIENFRDTSFSFTPQNLKKDLEIAVTAATQDKKVAYGLSGGIDSTLLAAVGANQSPQSISCYTAATGFGQDLKFARIAASYMKADLHEVPVKYDNQKLDDITKIIQKYGRPVHIWGNSVGNPILTQTAKDDKYNVFINGSSEHAVPGGIFANNIMFFIHNSIKKREWKLLFDTLSFNHQHKLLSLKKVMKEIFYSLFVVKDHQLTYKSKLKGKDFNGFFNPKIQSIRENLQTEKSYYTENLHYSKSYLTGGRLQRYTSQAYQSGNISNINVRLPFLDSRLIKYIDNDRRSMLKNKYNKQLAREAMNEIMDKKVIYREDDEGLRWKSTKFIKDNKEKAIAEIKASAFLKNILSEKTLHALDKPRFRKSLLLSLYSVALFDKSFHIKV